jgi:hypothetical protein
VLFNSLTFLVFFAVVLALHALPLPWRVKKINLLVASYVFYGAWNPPFVVLLWISTVLDWYVAGWIYREQRPARRRGLLLLSIAGNLGILGYFKYGEFLLQNWQAAMRIIGVEWVPPEWSIVLPVGISFYTSRPWPTRSTCTSGGSGRPVRSSTSPCSSPSSPSWSPAPSCGPRTWCPSSPSPAGPRRASSPGDSA